MQHIIELIIIALMFILSLRFIYKTYFTKQSSPCGDCHACDRNHTDSAKATTQCPSHTRVQVFFRQ